MLADSKHVIGSINSEIRCNYGHIGSRRVAHLAWEMLPSPITTPYFLIFAMVPVPGTGKSEDRHLKTMTGTNQMALSHAILGTVPSVGFVGPFLAM